MTSWLKKKRVLVTGGAGAFGRKFLRAATDAGAAGVVVFSRDEMKHAALKRELGALAAGIDFRIGDVTDPAAVATVLRRVDLVVHAAAMKHLPECEANPAASTRVNVLGTEIVARRFLSSGAECLVFLSTDKAPYASSVYGAQKYIGEKLVTETARLLEEGRRAFTLRYSNVMDSTGSAFHVFRQLLSADQTATVNGSQTSRGFVSQAQVIRNLDEALDRCRGGEVLVLIPRVIRIAELAETLKRLLGKGRVSVVETPGFAGEKESATLIMAEERALAREFPEVPEGAVLLDALLRSTGRGQRAVPERGLTLEDCQRLSGAELETFVTPLL